MALTFKELGKAISHLSEEDKNKEVKIVINYTEKMGLEVLSGASFRTRSLEFDFPFVLVFSKEK